MKHRNSFFAFIITIFLIVSGCATTTPLIKASAKGDSLTVEKLLNEGANINEPDSNGYTPLDYAISYGNVGIVKLLIDKGANVNTVDKYKTTLLMNAISYGNIDIVKLLIDKGADVNARDSSGDTVLMRASYSSYPEIAKLLLDKGADVNSQNNIGLTALHHIAQSYGDTNAGITTEYLLNKNASIILKDAKGWTAFRYAIYHRNIDVVATIRKKTNCIEEIESLGMGEALKNPSYYKPEHNMFNVPVGREKAYEIAITECNLMIIPDRTGLLFATGGVGYIAGIAIDAATVPKKFHNCMEKMGFECKNNCPNTQNISNKKAEEPIAPKESVVPSKVEEPITPKEKVKIEKKDEITKPNLLKSTNSVVKENNSEPSKDVQKLRELKILKDEGLMTDKEYEQKRKAIVDGM